MAITPLGLEKCFVINANSKIRKRAGSNPVLYNSHRIVSIGKTTSELKADRKKITYTFI